MSGQSITDRITAAQHSVTGSAVSKTVCKATTHEVMGPKKKHLDCEYPCLFVFCFLKKGCFPDPKRGFLKRRRNRAVVAVEELQGPGASG